MTESTSNFHTAPAEIDKGDNQYEIPNFANKAPPPPPPQAEPAPSAGGSADKPNEADQDKSKSKSQNSVDKSAHQERDKSVSAKDNSGKSETSKKKKKSKSAEQTVFETCTVESCEVKKKYRRYAQLKQKQDSRICIGIGVMMGVLVAVGFVLTSVGVAYIFTDCFHSCPGMIASNKN